MTSPADARRAREIMEAGGNADVRVLIEALVWVAQSGKYAGKLDTAENVAHKMSEKAQAALDEWSGIGGRDETK